MVVSQRVFGTTQQGQEVTSYRLENKNGTVLEVINYGAIVTTLSVADRNNSVADIVLGYDTVEAYESLTSRYLGATVGRVCNRIAASKFSLGGVEYSLARNNGPNHLHGGPGGFSRVMWESKVLSDTSVEMVYISRDGEEGYPGELTAKVTFELTNDGTNQLVLSFQASTSSKPTPVNLTNHSYFNLAGEGSPNVYDHRIRIAADGYTPVDATLIPTGEIKRVEGTPFDLRQPVLLSDRIHDIPGGGFDHNFCLESTKERHLAARVEHPDSGRVMEVYTTQPGVQFYTGNFLDTTIRGKNGASYPKHSAFCLETQNYPDAINQSNFPNCVLQPGELYEHTTWFSFSTL